jgi:hypothetical protein
MSQIKDFQIGSEGDGLTVGGSLVVVGTSTLGVVQASSFGAITATSANISGALTTATASITTATIGAVVGTSATLTNPLPIASGGTALTTLTAENVILGDGTNPVRFVAPSTTGNVLTSNGTTWTSAAPKLDQVVTSSTSAVTSVGGTAIPLDNTIPQNTEGTEILTATITPKSASSTLIITCSIGQVSPNDGRTFIVAFFQDSVADAFHTSVFVVNAGQNGGGTFTFAKTSGTTSATTFKVRLGPNVSATAYINGTSGGTQLFNGSCNATLMVTEIAS